MPIFSAAHEHAAQPGEQSSRTLQLAETQLGNFTPRVLIVDESDESQEVLRELLHRRGAIAVEARDADDAAEMARQYQPDLIVFDAESDHSDSLEATRRLVDAASSAATPVIVLGNVHRHRAMAHRGQFVAKPYHYGHLLRRIEDLLAAG